MAKDVQIHGVQIHGVQIVPRSKVIDDRGGIFHMLRKDDPEFEKFGEIYFSKVHPGVVKGWHLHTRMGLNYFVVLGSIQLGLWDGREGSSTYGLSQTIYLDEQVSQLVVVPAGIWNGFKGLGDRSSIVANCATEPHDPAFDYDWLLKHG